MQRVSDERLAAIFEDRRSGLATIDLALDLRGARARIKELEAEAERIRREALNPAGYQLVRVSAEAVQGMSLRTDDGWRLTCELRQLGDGTYDAICTRTDDGFVERVRRETFAATREAMIECGRLVVSRLDSAIASLDDYEAAKKVAGAVEVLNAIRALRLEDIGRGDGS